ncbi:Uncharacterized protein conserved in bacteria [Kluyvera cryocrescens]|uniref:Uncharacterized protein conserved in bacteria n=1 Tax=Kluyvera cryocrescens TaxID=580 RepID=A0A485CQQ0_KLUCR|nr:Uncharacterized protein conserved in bacteria [Kluyvera cryocrescens]
MFKPASHGNASRNAFEQALGREVLNEFSLYEEAELRSKRRCGSALKRVLCMD